MNRKAVMYQKDNRMVNVMASEVEGSNSIRVTSEK